MTQQQTTVLVVEDEESFVDALTVGLRRGFVQIARDGMQALDCSTWSTRILSCSM